MSQIKLEPVEDDIDEMNTSMQRLIERADWFLNNIANRSTNSSSSSDANNEEVNPEQPEPELPPEPESLPQIMSNSSTSSLTPHDDGNESSGSDTTIVCSTDEPMPEPLNPSPAAVNDSFGQDVIVIGTPTIEPRRNRRRVRQNICMPNADTSVIDLSNYHEEVPPSMPVIVLSSDEETEVDAPATTGPPQPSGRSNWGTVTIQNFNTVSVQSSAPHTISVSLSNTRRNRRRNDRQLAANNHFFNEDISMHVPVSSVAASRPPPQPQQQTNNVGTHAATEEATKSTSIICPICYEALANQRVISTSCGHCKAQMRSTIGGIDRNKSFVAIQYASTHSSFVRMILFTTTYEAWNSIIFRSFDVFDGTNQSDS
uniref:Uncharacterized protein n=1 Tax=Anopheles culicifacies TaxID=139723 RepID=A0A182LY06_9DIPT